MCRAAFHCGPERFPCLARRASPCDDTGMPSSHGVRASHGAWSCQSRHAPRRRDGIDKGLKNRPQIACREGCRSWHPQGDGKRSRTRTLMTSEQLACPVVWFAPHRARMGGPERDPKRVEERRHRRGHSIPNHASSHRATRDHTFRIHAGTTALLSSATPFKSDGLTMIDRRKTPC